MVDRLFLIQYAKTGKIYQITKSIPNYLKIYKIFIKYVYQMVNDHKIYIFHSKYLHKLLKLGFFCLWQP
jgi:hypothetical protein